MELVLFDLDAKLSYIMSLESTADLPGSILLLVRDLAPCSTPLLNELNRQDELMDGETGMNGMNGTNGMNCMI